MTSYFRPISSHMEVGLNHTPAYQVSGRPFAAAAVNATSATKVPFPYVTRWVMIVNTTATPTRVGFSELGVEGTYTSNYFTLAANSSSPVLEMKVSQLWLKGGNGIDIVAGLTTIPTERTTTDTGPSWSGSSGVG